MAKYTQEFKLEIVQAYLNMKVERGNNRIEEEEIMFIAEGFFDEIGFFESVCTSVEWIENKFIVGFDKGIDLGGSVHPLAYSLGVNEPCRLIFDGVVKSKLKVSKLINKPNDFEVH